MFRMLARWQRYAAEDRRILLQLAILLPVTDILLRTLGYARMNRWLTHRPSVDREDHEAIALGQHLAALARLVGHRHPWPTSCLRQALVVSYMLQRRQIRSRIVIGVAQSLSRAPAHAWVEVAGTPLDPASAGHLAFGDLQRADPADPSPSGPGEAAERVSTRLVMAALFCFVVGGLGPWAVRAGIAPLLPVVEVRSLAAVIGTTGQEAGSAADTSCPAPWQRPREEALAFREANLRFASFPLLAFVAGGLLWLLLLTVAARQRHPSAHAGILSRASFVLLMALSALAAAGAAIKGQWLALAVGLVALAPWVLGAVATGIATVPMRRRLAAGCVLILALQVVLAPIEVFSANSPYLTSLFGLEVRRLAGTFSTPTALGGFAVVTWATALSWGQLSRRGIALVTSLLLFVLLVVSSATAWIALLLVAAAIAHARARRRLRAMMLALALPSALAIWYLLPVMTGRSDVHDSAWGRVQPVVEFTRTHLSSGDIVFGYRFGVGAQSFEPLHLLAADAVAEPSMRPPVDSTASALFWQTGLLGVLAGYALLLTALVRDAAGRPLGIALLTCSLAFSITEVLPLAIVLGVWLASANSAPGQTIRAARPIEQA